MWFRTGPEGFIKPKIVKKDDQTFIAINRSLLSNNIMQYTHLEGWRQIKHRDLIPRSMVKIASAVIIQHQESKEDLLIVTDSIGNIEIHNLDQNQTQTVYGHTITRGLTSITKIHTMMQINNNLHVIASHIRNKTSDYRPQIQDVVQHYVITPFWDNITSLQPGKTLFVAHTTVARTGSCRYHQINFVQTPDRIGLYLLLLTQHVNYYTIYASDYVN